MKVADKNQGAQAAEGVAGMEQCAVAVRLAGTTPENVLPGIKVVGTVDPLSSAYQAKGYGYIALSRYQAPRSARSPTAATGFVVEAPPRVRLRIR